VKCRRGEPLPSLHVGTADRVRPAGNNAPEAKEEKPEENGIIFLFCHHVFQEELGEKAVQKILRGSGKNI